MTRDNQQRSFVVQPGRGAAGCAAGFSRRAAVAVLGFALALSPAHGDSDPTEAWVATGDIHILLGDAVNPRQIGGQGTTFRAEVREDGRVWVTVRLGNDGQGAKGVRVKSRVWVFDPVLEEWLPQRQKKGRTNSAGLWGDWFIIDPKTFDDTFVHGAIELGKGPPVDEVHVEFSAGEDMLARSWVEAGSTCDLMFHVGWEPLALSGSCSDLVLTAPPDHYLLGASLCPHGERCELGRVKPGDGGFTFANGAELVVQDHDGKLPSCPAYMDTVWFQCERCQTGDLIKIYLLDPLSTKRFEYEVPVRIESAVHELQGICVIA